MLPNAVVASTDRLVVAAIRCAWSQWSSVGALTHRGPQVNDEIVDVEALLLGSLGLAQREPRLRTLATDWALENSGLLSIARIRALMAGPFEGSALSIDELAHRVATEAGDARWRALVPGGDDNSHEVDSVRKRSNKAMPPRWHGARTLMLQLRRGLGVGVKPDLIAILLGFRSAWVDVSTLCEMSQYSVAGVRRAADDMADAGLIDVTRGYSRQYRAKVDAWKTLLANIGTPLWRRRADGFGFVLAWQRYLRDQEVSHASELSLGVGFVNKMTDYWRLWIEAGVTQEPVSEDSAHAWDSRDVAIGSLVRWFEDRADYGDEYDHSRSAASSSQ